MPKLGKKIKRKFVKRKEKWFFGLLTYQAQRKWIPRVWYNYCNCPNFKYRSIVIRWWDGYWGYELPLKKEQL